MKLLHHPRHLLDRKFAVVGISMKPGFAPDERVSITPYIWGPPLRLEIVMFRSPDRADRFDLKRVIGLPGEKISWKGSYIWIQDAPFDENYVTHRAPVPGEVLQTVTLRDQDYFVVGDNRLYSIDSRYYGPVNRLDILGRVLPPA
jgi:signal peptidase I